MDMDFIARITQSGDFDLATAGALAQESSPKVRLLVLEARASILTEALLLRLANDPEESIRLAMVNARNLPRAVQLLLADDPSTEVRLALAQCSRREEGLLPLCSDPDESVRQAAYANTSLKEGTVVELWQMEEPPQRFLLARHPSLGVGSQKLLADSGDVETIAGLLCHSNLELSLRAQLTPQARPGDLLKMLDFRLPTPLEWQRHRAVWSEEFRTVLAAKTKVPPAILRDLAGDESPAVRQALRERLLDKRRSPATAFNKALLERLTEV